MKSHVPGFPRIGAQRELKKALEDHWKGALSEKELAEKGRELRKRNWQIQKDAGLTFVATGDFSLYDHVLDITSMLGAIPERFRSEPDSPDPDAYFKMARGDIRKNIPAMDMTKWFDTNYHYIVPEITPDMKMELSSEKILNETREALSLGFSPKPVLVGPITWLSLAKEYNGADKWGKIDEILAVYSQVIGDLSSLCQWIQIDEPILSTNMHPEAKKAFVPALKNLKKASGKTKILLATYFGEAGQNLKYMLESGCDGIHLDLDRGIGQLDEVLASIPKAMVFSAGIVNGRNIWRADLEKAVSTLKKITAIKNPGEIMVSSSCSLLHVPVDLSLEADLDPEIKSWMSFAVQKCREVATLEAIVSGKDRHEDDVAASKKALENRAESEKVHSDAVKKRTENISKDMFSRKSPFAERNKIQKKELKLPFLPLTTIGSFPQTREIRSARLDFRKGRISAKDYEDFMKEKIKEAVDIQERLGFDVLVHGEPERNDMVEYFGEQLEGFCFTSNGWVQSYGSRCVKPPVIYGDVSRPGPMTLKWILYAQFLSKKPVKGMLTGPVTILCWSFERDDLERSEVCRQIALAIRDEVKDLEEAGINIIQIDEAAFREGMPLDTKGGREYLKWAVESFRLSSSCVSDSTQIHTHMCYSEFNEIMPGIAAMDADVISIESSRSGMELLNAFADFKYPGEIGPGIYDIHSPRVPSEEEMKALIEKALKVIPAERLWINPDCGLKTRAWPETLKSLENMVKAARQIRSLPDIPTRYTGLGK